MASLTGRTPKRGARTNRSPRRPLAKLAAFFLSIPTVAAAAPADVFSTETAMTVVVLAAGALAAAGGLWAIAERQQSRQLRRTLRITGARARAFLGRGYGRAFEFRPRRRNHAGVSFGIRCTVAIFRIGRTRRQRRTLHTELHDIGRETSRRAWPSRRRIFDGLFRYRHAHTLGGT